MSYFTCTLPIFTLETRQSYDSVFGGMQEKRTNHLKKETFSCLNMVWIP